jgi:hopene-associated glycosyltransferase HpnB
MPLAEMSLGPLDLLAGLSLLAWGWLWLFHGGFWRASERLSPAPAPARWPDVAIIIPARNEADSIGAVVSAHLAADYPGRRLLLVVDDGSTDGTADRALAAAAGAGPDHFGLVQAPPLPPGWSGKLWALDQGIATARRLLPEARWLLLTDADILHGPALLSRLVARGEAEGLALVSVMSRLDTRGPFAGLLIPAFIFFFQSLYPFAWVNDPARPAAGAAGGVVLVRREVLEGIGGIARLRGALIDDCTLAAHVKTGPPRRAIRLVLADAAAPATSLRDNRSLASIRDMVARTAYSQLRFSPLLMLGTLMGLALLFLVPPLAIVAWALGGSVAAGVAGALAWGLMAALFMPTFADYGLPRARALLLPVAGLAYGAFTLLSAWRHWRGVGGQWKGRSYS